MYLTSFWNIFRDSISKAYASHFIKIIIVPAAGFDVATMSQRNAITILNASSRTEKWPSSFLILIVVRCSRAGRRSGSTITARKTTETRPVWAPVPHINYHEGGVMFPRGRFPWCSRIRIPFSFRRRSGKSPREELWNRDFHFDEPKDYWKFD